MLRAHGEVSVFRPGSGWFTRRMLRDAGSLGYRCVLGSPGLLITQYKGDAAAQGRRLGMRAHEGAVVVLHEGTPDRQAVAVAADALLHVIAQRGLKAVTVRQLLSGDPNYLAHPDRCTNRVSSEEIRTGRAQGQFGQTVTVNSP